MKIYGHKNIEETMHEELDKKPEKMDKNKERKEMDKLESNEKEKGNKISTTGSSRRNLWKKTRTSVVKLAQLEMLKRAKKSKGKKFQYQHRSVCHSFFSYLFTH